MKPPATSTERSVSSAATRSRSATKAAAPAGSALPCPASNSGVESSLALPVGGGRFPQPIASPGALALPRLRPLVLRWPLGPSLPGDQHRAWVLPSVAFEEDPRGIARSRALSAAAATADPPFSRPVRERGQAARPQRVLRLSRADEPDGQPDHQGRPNVPAENLGHRGRRAPHHPDRAEDRLQRMPTGSRPRRG